MKGMALHWKILIGLILGAVWALVSSSMGWSQITMDWIAPFGIIFINLLKMIAVPLVFFSIIGGVSSLKDIGNLGRLGMKTLAAYLITTMLAVSLVLLVVNVFKPGEMASEEQRIVNRISYEIWVNSTPGVEIIDGKNFLEDPRYASYIDDANAVNQGPNRT